MYLLMDPPRQRLVCEKKNWSRDKHLGRCSRCAGVDTQNIGHPGPQNLGSIRINQWGVTLRDFVEWHGNGIVEVVIPRCLGFHDASCVMCFSMLKKTNSTMATTWSGSKPIVTVMHDWGFKKITVAVSLKLPSSAKWFHISWRAEQWPWCLGAYTTCFGGLWYKSL